MKTLEEEGLDSEGAVTSKSKLRSKVKALSGVDILTDTGAYKSTYQILLEISEVWNDINNDLDKAALLELISGKRNSSVVAAIVSNSEDLKAAYEDAMNAEGSALKENEKYMNSIQGRIDQFSNAVQTLWNHLIDDDLIKAVVSHATKIIQSLDTVPGKISAIIKAIALLMAYKKINPFEWVQKAQASLALMKEVGLKSYISSLLGIGNATKIVTAETVANTIATETNDAAKTKDILTNTGLASTTGVLSVAQKKQAADAILAAMSTGQLTTAQGNAILVMLGFAGATTAADGSLKLLDATTKSFLATNWVGWILLIVSAVISLVMWISTFKSKTEKLVQELSDLNSDLQNIQSELDGVNSELKTTQERMAELLAMDHLSFTEDEELKRLQLQSAELERQIQLQELLLDNKKEKRKDLAKTVIQNVWNGEDSDKKYWVSGNGTISEDKWWTLGVSGKDALNDSLPEYEALQEQNIQYQQDYLSISEALKNNIPIDVEAFRRLKIATASDTGDKKYWAKQSQEKMQNLLDKQTSGSLDWLNGGMPTLLSEFQEIIDTNQGYLDNMQKGIYMVLGDMGDIVSQNELSYSMDDPEINQFLDEYYAYSLKWSQAQGVASKSAVISAIWDNTESESMKALKDRLDEIADSSDNRAAKEINAEKAIGKAIEDTTGEYERLKTFMDITGISAQEMAKFFVNASEGPDINTTEGVAIVYQQAIDALQKYQDKTAELAKDENGASITWGNMFTEKDGKMIADKLKVAAILKGSNEDTREEFANIVESIENGEEDIAVAIDTATQKLQFSGFHKILDIEIAQLAETTQDIFPDLADDLDGIINKFEEFSKAVGGTVDALDTLKQARAEEAYSGSVSIETLENLMRYTDDYSKLVSVDETGAIKVLDGAENTLIQTRLDKIKQNAEIALQEAELSYQEALHTQQTVTQTGPAQETLQGVINQVGGSIAFVTSLWNDLTSGNWAGSWERATVARESSIAKNQSAYANKASEANANVAEKKKIRDQAANNKKIADALTVDNVKPKYSSDEASGGAGTKEDVAQNAFDEEMQYWENRISANQAKYEQIQNEIDALEAKGQRAGVEYYTEQIGLENQRKLLLESQKTEAKKYLSTLAEGSDEWWNVANQLNGIESDLDDVTSNIFELNNAMAQIRWDTFEEAHNRFSNLATDLQNIRDILSSDDMFDDQGNWTESGIATLGSYIQELEIYKNARISTEKELADLQKEYAGNETDYAKLGIDSEQELYDKRQELTDQLDDYTKAVNDSEQSVVEMYENQVDAVEEYMNELVDSYNDYIDVVKESLESERDLYDFRRKIKDQTKSISELERKISSLSGSTAASDVATRRKLEAELLESKESLNETYYSSAKDAQSQALDDEASAYEESTNRYVESLREKLNIAKRDMDTFMSNVSETLMFSAETVLQKYSDTGLAMSKELTQPWVDVAKTIDDFNQSEAMALMNSWTQAGGTFDNFNLNATADLTSPWDNGTSAANAFNKNVKIAMDNVVKNVKSNINQASEEVSKFYQQIEDTSNRTKDVFENDGGGQQPDSGQQPSGGQQPDGGSKSDPKVVALQSYLNKYFSARLQVDGKYGPATAKEVSSMQRKIGIPDDGKYDSKTYQALSDYYDYLISAARNDPDRDSIRTEYKKRKNEMPSAYYAKGTLGTKKDQLSLDSEPQYGDELVLVPNKGVLSYMRKGTSVVPAQLTEELMKIGEVGLNGLMQTPKFDSGINVINTAINKPEYNFSFDNLVHVDTCSQETLPQVQKIVKTELDSFMRRINYSLKRV